MRFETPSTIEEATGLLSGEPGVTRILNGGTDVLVGLNTGLVEPDLVIDIKRIPRMGEIAQEKGGFRIGAAVTCAEMCEHEALRSAWPGIVESAGLIGSTQIQGRATIAGNICNASPAADAVPALVAAQAIATIVGPEGSREMQIEAIPKGPGQTHLGSAEIIESIFVPAREPRSADAYERFIPRTEMDIAVVGAGINLTLDEAGSCKSARLALGAVAKTVILVPQAAEILIGATAEGANMDELALAASEACRPINDKRGTISFRTKVAGVLARRVATLAFARAGSTP